MFSRRGILGLFGGAVATPALGVKTAAKVLGAEAILNTAEPFPPPQTDYDAIEKRHQRWYNSIAAIAQEADHDARQEWSRHRYAHMKSWGAGFRHSVIRRELIVEEMFRRKINREDDFLEKVLDFFRR